MKILHKWTVTRIKKAICRFRNFIPEQDLEHIDSLLGKIVYTEDTSKIAEAGAGILDDGKYCVVFFLRYLWYKPIESLFVTVAHEFAHVFLEHKSKSELPDEEAEEAVHTQLKEWGIVEIYYTFYFPSKKNPFLVIDILP